MNDRRWQLLDRVLWGLAIGLLIFGLVRPTWAIELPVGPPIEAAVKTPVVAAEVQPVVIGLAPEKLAQAGALFELQCSCCHVNGGNIVRRGKTLKLKALQANKVDTQDAIEALITHGKGIMSAYADRLSAGEIELLAQYVLDRAAAGWPS